MKLVNQLTSAKLRLRGRGSGYLEGSSRLGELITLILGVRAHKP